MKTKNLKTQRTLAHSLYYGVIRRAIQVIFSICFSARCIGRENLPAQGGVLLACNHQSYLDPMLAAMGLRRQVNYMAKDSLFRNPLGAWLLRSLATFPVKRGSADLTAIKEALRILKNGEVLALFGEGTRSHDGAIAEIQPGIIMLARKAQVPVVPVVIDGTFEAWPRNRKICRFSTIRVMYGQPMPPQQINTQGDKLAAVALWKRQLQMQRWLRNHYGLKPLTYPHEV